MHIWRWKKHSNLYYIRPPAPKVCRCGKTAFLRGLCTACWRNQQLSTNPKFLEKQQAANRRHYWKNREALLTKRREWKNRPEILQRRRLYDARPERVAKRVAYQKTLNGKIARAL